MASLVLTIRETLRYRGSIGQWSWVLHRVTGLGVVLFLTLHVIDTSWSVFYPALYEHAIKIYQSPLFTLGEFALVFCVVYHAFNGLRIAVMDNRPDLWVHQERAAWGVLGLTILVLIPVFIGMLNHVLHHYSEPVSNLPLDEVIISQLPFVIGMGAAVVGALILSTLYGLVMGNETTQGSVKNSGSALERMLWSFMRVSGLLIVPLVFGHLALIHVIQGVFDLSLAGGLVTGVPQVGAAMQDAANAANVIGNGWNDLGLATEFVAERWEYLIGPVKVWRVYDIFLLALVTVHGFNGLRYVLTDYTAFSPLLRRTATYVCVIGAIVLLGVGGAALLTSIDMSTINFAKEALRAAESVTMAQ